MKKLFIIMSLLLSAAVGFAQDAQIPNRLLVNDNGYNYKGFVIDNIENLTFVNVEGEVSVSAEIVNVENDKLTVNIQRSVSCYSFKLDVIPASIANQLTNDAIAINYMDSNPEAPTFYQDFNPGELTGIDLSPGSDYALLLIAIDGYGIECTATIVPFQTPSIPVIGNPMVEAEMISNTTRSFTMHFTPNEDVSTYYCVAGEIGSMEQQYEFFGPMFGFTNFNEMIAAWGYQEEGPATEEWTGMEPGKEYEVLVAVKDINGNFAPYQTFYASTLDVGGHGDAYVDITPGDYVLNNWYGDMLPSQFFTFTPNSETAMFRFEVCLAENYDADPEAYNEDLCQEPPVPGIAYWFFYEPITTDFQINPNTDVVAIAAGKNSDDVWGKVNVVRYTTPSAVGEEGITPYSSNRICKRFNPQKTSFEKGKIPALGNSSKLKLQLSE